MRASQTYERADLADAIREPAHPPSIHARSPSARPAGVITSSSIDTDGSAT